MVPDAVAKRAGRGFIILPSVANWVQGVVFLNVYVIEEGLFFRTSMPIADQQRLLLIPRGKSLAAGDRVFLRDAEGHLNWVADVLFVGDTEGPEAWSGAQDAHTRFAIFGWLARIHPGVLPEGRVRFQSNWVLLNRRTLPAALPWWENGVLVYHSTLRLVEGVLTAGEVEKGEAIGCIVRHPSGHWCIPHGEARKRFLIKVRNEPLVCRLCGSPIPSAEEATQDHIIPVSQGGPDTLSNVQLAHRICNEAKGNALPEQYPAFFAPPSDVEVETKGRARGRRRSRGVVVAAVVRPAAPAVLPEPAAPASGNGKVAVPAGGAVPAAAGGAAGAAAEGSAEREDGAAWLAEIQQCGWQELMARAGEQGWAARTAELRTLQQIRRGRIAAALAEGRPIAEATGPKGRFRLLEWNGQTVLVEEHGNRQTLHQVRMMDALTPEVYVWYLSRFGRAAPLTVAMALMALFNQGTPDGQGRIVAWRGDQPICLRIENDRVTECGPPDDTQVA